MMKNLTKKIEKLFDNPLEHKQHAISLEEIRQSFIIAEDNHQIENLSYVFTKDLHKKDTALIFSQLASFFEIGFLFEKTNSRKYQATHMFAYSLQMKKLDGLPLIHLPQCDMFKVLQTNSRAFLSKLKLSDYDEPHRLGAFMIRISQTETLVLLSSLADPWAKVRLEALQNSLMKINFK